MDSRGVVERYIPSLPCPLASAPHPLVLAPRPHIPLSLRRRPVPAASSRPRVAVPSRGGWGCGMGVVVAWTSRWLGVAGVEVIVGVVWWGSRSRWRGGGCRCRCRVRVVVVVDDVAWRGVDVLVASSTWRSLLLLWLHRRGVVVSGRRHGRPVVVVKVAPSSLSSWRCRHRVSTHIS